MTFFFSYHMFIFKIKSLLYALKRAQALSLSFLKHLAYFVRSLWWRATSTGVKSVETVPAILLHPFSPCSDTVPPTQISQATHSGGQGAGRRPGGRWASDSPPAKWEPSSAPSGLWLDRCSLEARRGSLYVLCWVWEWTLALREWAVSKWLFFGNLTSPISSIQSLRYMFPVICKTKQWSLQTLEEYVEFLIKWSQVGVFFIILALVLWKKHFFNFLKSIGSLKCKHF